MPDIELILPLGGSDNEELLVGAWLVGGNCCPDKLFGSILPGVGVPGWGPLTYAAAAAAIAAGVYIVRGKPADAARR